MHNPISLTIPPTIALAIARRLTEIWYSNKPPPRALRAVAGLYQRVARRRLQRPTAIPPCPVIVVGNLVAGGSGKTPVVAALADALTDAGFAVSIITRGYGGSGGAAPLRVRPESPSLVVGDEALELFHRTGRPVWVCRRRAAALEAAVEDGAEVVLADDGLQHTELARSFEICVIDGRRGFGNGYCLPAGPLRQPAARLETVDMVLVKNVGDEVAPGLEGKRFRLESGELRALRDGSPPPEPPAEIDALAGIADPEPFFEMLASSGFRPRRHALVDHQPITAAMLDELSGPVVMTEKDAMRLPPVARMDLFVLPVRARLPENVLQRVAEHVREFCP
ncbi:MAG: tetraacyldisaccharide 4'-kinase [Wenzhouxiangellaceae bacterium]